MVNGGNARERAGARAWAFAVGPSLVAACSLVSPSSDELSGAFVADAGPRDAKPAAVDEAAAALACAPGTKPCGSACVSTSAPATGCAAPSCEPCAFAHAAPICVGGACAPGPCENGWANCNGAPADGCEVDTRSSSQFCGSCLASCSGGLPLCSQGECVPRCHAVKLTNAQARVSFANAGLDFGSGDFTVEAWVRRHADFSAPSGDTVVATNGSYFEHAFAIRWSGDALTCDVTRLPSDPSPPVRGPAPTDSAWHHLACVRSGAALRLLVDGQSIATGSAGADALTATSPAVVGAFYERPAKPLFLGPMRWSRVARYASPFTPRWHWRADVDTVAQFLVTRGFDGSHIEDEAGRDNDGTSEGGIGAADEEAPCK